MDCLTGRASGSREAAPALAVRLAVGLALAAAGCGGRTNLAPVPECPGCRYVHSDNPVLTGTAELSVRNGAVEEALRSDDSSWRFNHFELTLSATGGDAAQGSMDEPDPYAGPMPWPSQRGDWAPAPGNPVAFQWEAHGLRVGYANLTVNAQKQDAIYHKTVPILGTVLRLDPKTILVPIQIAQLVPDYTGAPFPTATEHFDEATNEVWFDDRWNVHVQRVSAPDGSIDHVSASIVLRPDASGGAGYYRQIQPDRIFGQCNIQFRMIAFRRVKVPKQIWEMVDDAGHPICSADEEFSQLRDARDLAFDAGLDPSVPVVMYTRSLLGDGCSALRRNACSFPSCSSPFVAIPYYLLQGPPYTLSHQLGYLLGLDDLPFNPDTCNHESAQPLMCGGSGFTNAGAGSCNAARRGAAALSNRYYGTHF